MDEFIFLLAPVEKEVLDEDEGQWNGSLQLASSEYLLLSYAHPNHTHELSQKEVSTAKA